MQRCSSNKTKKKLKVLQLRQRVTLPLRQKQRVGLVNQEQDYMSVFSLFLILGDPLGRTYFSQMGSGTFLHIDILRYKN